MKVRRSLRFSAKWAALALAVLAGHVTDQTTGQPLPGVRVQVGTAHATTAQDGSYRVGGLHPGHATVTLSSDDVPPQQFTVNVRAGTVHQDFSACSVTLDYHCTGPR